MRSKEDLRAALRRIDRRSYKAYKDIEGTYDFRDYVLLVDRAQGDPFAAPSNIRVRVSQKVAKFPEDTFTNRSREIALRDYITRAFFGASKRYGKGGRGTGKSGLHTIDQPGQEILERTSVFVAEDFVEARFVMGLPAFGRRIAGHHAESMFFEELPKIVRASLYYENLDGDALLRHILTAEDADALRDRLEGLDLVAFVADGAILPRASGIDPRPLSEGKIVSFESPESLRVTTELPNQGKVTGLGIPEGVTLIVGGG